MDMEPPQTDAMDDEPVDLVFALIAPELVDFIEDDDWVLGARILQGGNDAPRKGAHVRSPMASHLGLVRDPAERYPRERPT